MGFGRGTLMVLLDWGAPTLCRMMCDQLDEQRPPV